MSWISRRTDNAARSVPPQVVSPMEPRSLYLAMFERGHDPAARWDEVYRLDWIDDFERLLQLKKEIAEIEAEKAEVMALPVSKADLMESIREKFRRYMEEPGEALVHIFSNPRFSGFDHLPDRFKDRPFITEAQVEEALGRLPDVKGAISVAERRKKMDKLEAKIEAKRAEMEPLSDRRWFEHTVNQMDCRKLFISHWVNIQKRLSKPANILGFDLSVCRDQEKRGWKMFIGKERVNLNGQLPYNPNL